MSERIYLKRIVATSIALGVLLAVYAVVLFSLYPKPDNLGMTVEMVAAGVICIFASLFVYWRERKKWKQSKA